ncbi:site-2 protease family protein [Parahaliea maris]|uniref:site-2 protease family protein n=1 Tax=Parahaliea maris TaxID=2716870 RepID=UPI00164F102C|nr:site-2 protease family protein [Parahaliea maris]
MLQDRTSGRYHLCSPSAYYMISLMDGKRTVEEIWNRACEAFPDERIEKADITRLLITLYSSDVLLGDVPPDVSEQTDRGQSQRRRKNILRFLNPLAVRVPLLDPDRFLSATLPWLRFLFTPWAALAYGCLLLYSLALVGEHWAELTHNMSDRVLTAENLLILLLVYPAVKTLHELGHGYALKRWGGEVHEIGVMFLVFMPVPYVDASAASAYQNKWQRALVGAAGILVEVLLACIALLVWVAVEDGLVRACAYNVMLIGGVSTLLFNGNPLLRFDGYFVLQDLLEIPNLGPRSNRHVAWLVKRKLLGVDEAQAPANSPGEARWMLVYAICSFIYRLFIMAAIILFVASRYFVIGVVLAIWSALLMLGLPLARQCLYLFSASELRGRRTRAIGAALGALGLVAVTLLLVPLPYNTISEGIVWVPGDGAVRSKARGVVESVVSAPASPVEQGTVLIKLSDPFLDKEVAVHQASVNELELRHAEQDIRDRVSARIIEEQLRQARADLGLAEQNRANLEVMAGRAGTLALPAVADLPGTYIERGSTLGYVAEFSAPVVRVVVSQDAIEQVRNDTRAVEIRLVERMAPVVSARVSREIPSLTDTLPSPALSTLGGGRFLLDPADPEQRRVLDGVYNLELEPLQAWPVSKLGMRVMVKFVHRWEPLGWRLYRGGRRLFLRQLSV